MASHRDDDFGDPETNEAVRKLFEQRAEELTEKRANLITAGEPGEKAVASWHDVNGMTVRQMPFRVKVTEVSCSRVECQSEDDPLALRVSIGEPRALDEGSYCVFRGDLDEVLDLLNRAVECLRSELAARPTSIKS